MRHLHAFGALAFALLLCGCIFFEGPAERAMRNDPNFKAGYSDGCASANARGTNYRGDTVRDDAAYETSRPYRAGWSAGYSTCNNQYNANPGSMPGEAPHP